MNNYISLSCINILYKSSSLVFFYPKLNLLLFSLSLSHFRFHSVWSCVSDHLCFSCHFHNIVRLSHWQSTSAYLIIVLHNMLYTLTDHKTPRAKVCNYYLISLYVCMVSMVISFKFPTDQFLLSCQDVTHRWSRVCSLDKFYTTYIVKKISLA